MLVQLQQQGVVKILTRTLRGAWVKGEEKPPPPWPTAVGPSKTEVEEETEGTIEGRADAVAIDLFSHDLLGMSFLAEHTIRLLILDITF